MTNHFTLKYLPKRYETTWQYYDESTNTQTKLYLQWPKTGSNQNVNQQINEKTIYGMSMSMPMPKQWKTAQKCLKNQLLSQMPYTRCCLDNAYSFFNKINISSRKFSLIPSSPPTPGQSLQSCFVSPLYMCLTCSWSYTISFSLGSQLNDISQSPFQSSVTMQLISSQWNSSRSDM